MTDPTIPATLTQAAERADKVLPPTIAELVYNELKGAGRGPDCYPDSELPFAHAIAREVLAMAAPVPAVDRDSLAKALRDAACTHDVKSGLSWSHHMAAELVARGLVTTPSPVSQEARQQVRDILETAYEAIDPQIDTRHDGAVADLVAAGLVTTGQAQAVTAGQIETATKAVYEADDWDYGDHEQALALKRDKPHLDNCWPRYEGLARAAIEALGLPVEEGGQGG